MAALGQDRENRARQKQRGHYSESNNESEQALREANPCGAEGGHCPTVVKVDGAGVGEGERLDMGDAYAIIGDQRRAPEAQFLV